MSKLTMSYLAAAAWLCAAGWILSWLHQLNAAGYLGAVGVGALVIWAWLRKSAPARSRRQTRRSLWLRMRRRFGRPLPLLFLVVAVGGFVGGALHQPGNADAVVYRLPRVLQWLMAGQWHWIHTRDFRQNAVGCDVEWLWAPLILFTQSDRLLFLLNAASFLLLPGLLFASFRRLGVGGRAAWSWMWLVPAGWCYTLQAGSIGNDSLAAVYALGAVGFALWAGQTGNHAGLCVSVLAAALLTGAKQTNLPLLLPWLVAFVPCLRRFVSRPLIAAASCLVAALASALPLTVLNLYYTGTWSGWPAEQALQPASALVGIVGNTFALTVQNLVPPLFPWADAWNGVMARFLATPLGAHFRSFDGFGALHRAATETCAGLGLALCALTVATLWAARPAPLTAKPALGRLPWREKLLLWSPWLALLVFMAKVGADRNARWLAPYYVLMFPLLIRGPRHCWVVRQRWWRLAAVLVMLCAVALTVLSRQRPLWPAQAVLGHLRQACPASPFLKQVYDSYTFESEWSSDHSPIRSLLPAGETRIGFACQGVAEACLWRPYGSRQVIHVLDQESRAEIARRRLRYIIVNDRAVKHAGEPDIQAWLRRRGCVLVDSVPMRYDASLPAQKVYLARVGGN
jgi:hypothetical protein